MLGEGRISRQFHQLVDTDTHTYHNVSACIWSVSQSVCVVYVLQRRRYMFLLVFVRLFVCEQDYSKTRAWIWIKCCVSTDVGTWTN